MIQKVKLILIVCLLMFGTKVAFGQQDPMFTKYFFNTLNYNPGYAGSKEYLSGVLLAREQWVSFGRGLENNGGAPSSQTLSIHAPFKKRIGLGLNFSNDRVGSTRSNSIAGIYAYKIPFGEAKLSIGISAGVTNWQADWDNLVFRSPRASDPIFAANIEPVWIPTVGTGLYFYNKFYYIGFSTPRLFQYPLRNNQGAFADLIKSAQVYPHYFFTTGAAFRVRGDDIIFKPSVLIKNVGLFNQFSSTSQTGVSPIAAPTEFDIDMSLLFYEKMWLGISFRSAFEHIFQGISSHDSADVWASFFLGNGLRLGVAYDFPLSELNNYTVGSFELMIGYDFDYKVKKVTTPRYF